MLGVLDLKRVAVTLLAGLAACTASSPSPGAGVGAWPMYRGDLSRDGHPAGEALDIAEAQRLVPAWRAPLGGPIDGSPVVAGGVVVAASDSGNLAAYDARTGSKLWEKATLGPISGSPTVGGNRVFAGTLSGHLRAFTLAGGDVLWDWKAPGEQPAIWSSPTVYDDLVLVGIGSQAGDTPLEVGRMVALDVATGRQVWSICARAACAPGGGIWSTPAIDASGRAYVGLGNPEDGALAFEAGSGRRIWERSFYPDEARDLDVGASPVIVRLAGREAVAVGSVAGIFELLDASTGAVIWSDDLVRGSAVHGLIASAGYDGMKLFVGSASPPTGMFAVAAEGGAQVWRRDTDQPVYSAPAVGAGVLVFGTGAVFGDTSAGLLLALATGDGRVLWRYDMHSSVRSAPAIAGGLVVVGDVNGDLVAFQPSS